MDNELFYEYAELVKEYKSGNENAFTEIYERSSKFVYMTCINTLGNPEDAQDAMQETYMTVINSINDLEDEAKFLGWIKKIAVYKSIDIQRKKRDVVSYEDAIASEEILEGNDDLESLPEYFITEKTKREEFHKLIKNELSDVQYQTVLFHYFNEMSVEDIASTIGCPEGTVKTRLKSARIKIRSAVEKYEKENEFKLGAFVGASFLAAFFKEEALALSAPELSSLALSFGSTAAKAASAAEKAASATSRSAAEKAASGTARAAAKTTFFGTVGGKIAIGAAAVTVLVAAGIGIAVLTNREDKKEDEPEQSVKASETTTSAAPVASETIADTTQTTAAELTDPFSAPDTGWVDGYNKLMQNIDAYDFNNSDIALYIVGADPNTQIMFDLVFIDDDDVPELVASLDSPTGERLVRLYTFSNDSVVFLEEFYSFLVPDVYAPRKNWILTSGSYTEDGEDVYYGIASVDYTHSYINYVYPTDSSEYFITDYNTGENTITDKYYEDYNINTYTYYELGGTHTLAEMQSLMPTATVIITPDVSDCYSAPDTGWAAAYTDVVLNIDISDLPAYYQSDMNDEDVLCDLAFINGDQVPELIISFETQYSEYYIMVYTYVNGEAVFLDDFSSSTNSVTYIPGENKILSGSGYLYMVMGMDPVFSAGAYWMTEDCTGMEYVAGYNANYDITDSSATPDSASDEYDRYFTWSSETGYVEVPEPEYNNIFGNNSKDSADLVGKYMVSEFLDYLPGDPPSADLIPDSYTAPTATAPAGELDALPEGVEPA